MKHHLTLLLTTLLAIPAFAEDKPVTKFLKPGEEIFSETFQSNTVFEKPTWYQRKSNWVVEEGVLRGTNDGGNGPFIRLQSIENGGPLPEDYIMTFSFKIGVNPTEKKSNKHHDTHSSGHRFSFGHYAAKFQWRPDTGMDLNIGHGDALADDSFYIDKGKWYHVTAEIRGDEILVWFQDGPAYFMQHDHFRSKPSGWEFFTHVSEFGYLDNLKVWSLDSDQSEQPSWSEVRAEIAKAKRMFLSSENPDFVITKQNKK